jgi:hypothetical protein
MDGARALARSETAGKMVVHPISSCAYGRNCRISLSYVCCQSICEIHGRQKEKEIMKKTWQKLHDDPSLWKRYFIREKVLTAIRRFFFDRNFHEIETPYLTGSLPPESYLDVKNY